MKCLECETELNDNDTKCPKCGLPIYKIENTKTPKIVSNQTKRQNTTEQKINLFPETPQETTPNLPTKKYCSHCNNEIDINDNYCKKCGTKITSALDNPKNIDSNEGNIYAIISLFCLIISIIIFLKGDPTSSATYIISIIGLLVIITGKMQHPQNKFINIVSKIFTTIIIIAIVILVVITMTCVSCINGMGGALR